MRKFCCLFFLAGLFVASAATAQTVFINEIHYDNASTDANEGIEVAGPAGTDLSGWSLVLYNGNNGQVYETITLSGTLANQQNGYGTKFFPAPGLQNGSPDGLALVNDEGAVLQFLSYEGSFVAIGGPADSLISVDIGIAESGSTPLGQSLQLTGTGSEYADFVWSGPIASTYDSINAGQNFVHAEPVVFINEIHYDNSGTDVNEGIEVAGTAGTDLSSYTLVLYNGNNGAVYQTVALSGVLPNQDNGYGTAFFAISGLQNGSPDGVALVNAATNKVIQFLSYEGSFTAVGGPADSLMSTDIGVAETSGTPVGFSLQLTGKGTSYVEFSWSEAIASTYGQVNTGQSFGGVIVNPGPDTVNIATARILPLGTEVFVCGTLTVTNQLGGPAFIQDQTAGIAVFDSLLQSNPVLSIGDSVCMVASVGVFNGQIQLVDVTDLQIIGVASNPVEPTVVPLDSLNFYEGQLVTVESVDFINKGIFFPGKNYTISNGGSTSQVRIDDNVESLIGNLIPEGLVSVTGVIGSFKGSMQILPRFAEDIPASAPYEPIGDSISFSSTLDVASWNMEFFGATQPQFGPADIQLQLQNAVKVLDSLNADIIAVQEVSNDSLLIVLASQLEGNYTVRCSDVYSFSYLPPDPNFPPQKLCYIYNADVINVVEEKVVFEEFYEKIRTVQDTVFLPGYPTNPSRFWASGRLPYLLTVDATINGVTERISLVNIHAISGSNRGDYSRRLYDVNVLKDTLDQYYGNQQVILLGDYNDDVDVSISSGSLSPYNIYVTDTADYEVATLPLSLLGFQSFVFGNDMIDHITISNELFPEYVEGSATVFLPFDFIPNYANTTSDHLPVRARFELSEPLIVSITGDLQVFYGYDSEECTTLTANVQGGSGEYTYQWSTGQTTQSIEVCPSGTQTYYVQVTDKFGNTSVAAASVCVVDVTCGSFRGQDKVELCWQLKRPRFAVYISLCLPEQMVPFFIERGATLGACFESTTCDSTQTGRFKNLATRSATEQPKVEYVSIDEVLSLQSISNNDVQLQFVVLEDGKTSLKMYNAAGQLVQTLHESKDVFGNVYSMKLNKSKYKSGLYIIQMTTSSGEKFTKKIIF